jgi:pentatricopeptide repeat protein
MKSLIKCSLEKKKMDNIWQLYEEMLKSSILPRINRQLIQEITVRDKDNLIKIINIFKFEYKFPAAIEKIALRHY